MNNTVYLAGPIAGLSYNGATNWRDTVKAALAKAGIRALSPMRAKEYLQGINELGSSPIECEHYGSINCMSSPRGITTRDRFDATHCGVLLVNLLGAKSVSIGTVMEIAWADLCRTPIVVAMEKHGNPHDHAMITESIGFRVDSLDSAVHVVGAILDRTILVDSPPKRD